MTKIAASDKVGEVKTAVVDNFTEVKTNSNMKSEVEVIENDRPAENGNGTTLKAKRLASKRGSLIKGRRSWKKLTIRFLDHSVFQFYMFICLILALFAVDVVALHSYGDDVTEGMNWVLMIVFVSFLLEMIANVIVREEYSRLETFMNFIATFSILLDITWITELYESDSSDSSSYEKASRAARVGARAGRIGRIVRVIRLVRVIKMFALFFSCFKKEEKEDSMAPTNLGQKLAESVSRRVALLIMITIWVAPLLSYEEFDMSLQAWITMFESTRGVSQEQLELTVIDYYDFTVDGGIMTPMELYIDNQTWNWVEQNGGYTARSKDKLTLKSDDKTIEMSLDVSAKNQEEAILNILLVVFVVIELILFITLLNQTTNSLVVKPLERIFTIIRINATQIVGALDIEDEDDEDEKETDEINTIEAAVMKMTRIVKHVSGGGSQGAHMVQNLMEDANIDAKTRAWLQNQYDGTEVSEEPTVKKKKAKSSFKLRQKVTYDNVNTDFMNSWDFDVFTLTEAELFSYVRAMFMECGLYEAELLDDKMLEAFLKEVRTMYHDNPYHNFFHCIDVTHGVYRMIRLTDERLEWTTNEKFSLLVAAICHDMDHPGVNNAYLTTTLDPLAIKYNDSSILENTHVASLYSMVTSKPQANIFSKVTDKKVWRDMRKNIIACILHTDMSHHFKLVSQMEVFHELHSNAIEKRENTFETPEDRQFIMNIILHSADISNAVKPFGIYTKWADCVLEEFFSQGDKEKDKGLPISPMMDRNNTSKAMSQVNFIEFIVGPLYLNVMKLCPELSELPAQLLANRNRWGDLYTKELGNDNTKTFQVQEEEDSKCKNRFLKFKEKFQPVLESMVEQGYLNEEKLRKLGMQQKPKVNVRGSIISNMARRASISMGARKDST